jgi:hypothetical protein
MEDTSMNKLDNAVEMLDSFAAEDIPQVFVEAVWEGNDRLITNPGYWELNVMEQTIETLIAGDTEDEEYIFCWSAVLENAVYTDEEQRTWRLHQEGGYLYRIPDDVCINATGEVKQAGIPIVDDGYRGCAFSITYSNTTVMVRVIGILGELVKNQIKQGTIVQVSGTKHGYKEPVTPISKPGEWFILAENVTYLRFPTEA